MPESDQPRRFIGAAAFVIPMPEIVFKGPDIIDVFYLIEAALRFAGGPGLDGFHEYLMTEHGSGCDAEPCTHSDEQHHANLGRHTLDTANRIADVLGQMPS